MGPQPSAVDHRRGAPGRALLLRQARLHRDVRVRARPGRRAQAAHRTRAGRGRHRRQRRRRRSAGQRDHGALRAATGPRAGERDQHRGSGRGGAGRRGLEHRAPVSKRAEPVGKPYLLRHRAHRSFAREAWRRQRRAGCGVAVAARQLRKNHVIEIKRLGKIYRVHKRPPGMAAALRSVFRRKYESVQALDDLTFSIGAGERVGFLGPNGAGKTTTLKILSGLLHPTSGQVTVAGFVPQARATTFLKTITLVMGQKQQLLWDLPPSETFAMNRALYDLPRKEAAATQATLVELLEIGDLVNKPTRQLSLGERMKCELVAALLHQPKILFLDEPTIGLDVSMQARIRQFIREYNERFGATVILTSHYMEDVAALCPRVVVIDKGRLIYDGELKELVHKIRPEKRITIRLSAPADPLQLKQLGVATSHTDGQVVLTVPVARVSEVLRA